MLPVLNVDKVPARAFGLAETLEDFHPEWHCHARHQPLYAAEGVLHLGVRDGQWLLPPQRAAWIGAGVHHQVQTASTALRTVYLGPELVPLPSRDCCVFPVTPLAREMLLHAMRLGPSRDPEYEAENRYFAALAMLALEWAEQSKSMRLPAAQTPELVRAMLYALDHLEGASFEQAARAAGLSTRTLNRRFAEEAQTTWRRFVHDARLMRAMELLAVRGARVTEVAFDVGFESLSAFTRAFEEFTGELPKDYRHRVQAARCRRQKSGGEDHATRSRRGRAGSSTGNVTTSGVKATLSIGILVT